MGVFARMMNLSKAAVHETLDKLESPELMLNQYLRNMEQDIDAVQQELGRQRAAERGLKLRLEDAIRLVEENEMKATDAVAEGYEEEAREALGMKLYYMEKIKEYEADYTEAKRRSAELEHQLEQAQAEYARLKEKKNELTARARQAAAKAQTVMPSVSRGMDAGTAARGFERIEEKIMQLEIQTELASKPYVSAGGGPRDDHRREAFIEEQLQRLRSTTSSSAPTAQS